MKNILLRTGLAVAGLAVIGTASYFGSRALHRTVGQGVITSGDGTDTEAPASGSMSSTSVPSTSPSNSSSTQTTRALPSSTVAADGKPVIYVSIASHSEDTSSPGTPDFSADKGSFDTQRAGVVAFANMLASRGAAYDWQSDWNFLNGIAAFDTGNSDTNGKNLACWLTEDMGFEADPHSHQHNGYNYADVAYLISSLGADPSPVVGGFIAIPASASELPAIEALGRGSKFPSYAWKPEVLWGGGAGLHQGEESAWISGVWRPKSAEEYDVHDPSGTLAEVGHYASGWQGLDELLALRAAGSLEAGKIYTVTLMSNQPDFTDSYVRAFGDRLDRYASYAQSGAIVYATIMETYDAWVRVYGSVPSVLHWAGLTTTSDPGPGPNSEWSSSVAGSSRFSGASSKPGGSSSGAPSFGGGANKDRCGDGTCEEIERRACPQDCT